MYYKNVRVKAPVELVQQLIGLTSRKAHRICDPLLTLFHFFSASFAVTHPSIDTYFHNSGWNSHFYTPLPVAANSRSVRFHFIFFTEAASFSSVRVGHGASSHYCAWQKKGEYTLCVFRKHTHTLSVNDESESTRDNWIRKQTYLFMAL